MIGSHGEAERFGRAANLHRVDADHLSLAVQQRAAAVARIDRGIGLQHHRAIGAADRADDAARHAVLKHAERQADRNHFLAGPHVVDRAERQHGCDGSALSTRTTARSYSVDDASTRPGSVWPFERRTVTDTLSLDDVSIGDDRPRRREKSAAAPLARFDRHDRRNRAADDVFQCGRRWVQRVQ